MEGKERKRIHDGRATPFTWGHFEAEIVLLYVRWYLRYALSYRDLEEMMLERGLHVDHPTMYRWGQHYAPELEKRSRPYLKACNNSWRVDETSIKIKKVWVYLYRAVDSEGTTLEFLLSSTRDAEAAKRFFLKALSSTASSTPEAYPFEEQVAQPMAGANPTTTPTPRVINVDKNAAYPKAMAELKDHGRFLKRSNSGKSNISTTSSNKTTASSNGSSSPGWASFLWKRQGERCKDTRVMNMIRKGQVRGLGKGDSTDQVAFIARLCGAAA